MKRNGEITFVLKTKSDAENVTSRDAEVQLLLSTFLKNKNQTEQLYVQKMILKNLFTFCLHWLRLVKLIKNCH